MPSLKKKSSSPARGVPKRLRTKRTADNNAPAAGTSNDSGDIAMNDLSTNDMLKLVLQKMEKTEETNANLRRDLDMVMSRQNPTEADPTLPGGSGPSSSTNVSDTVYQSSPANAPVLPSGEGNSHTPSNVTGTSVDQSFRQPPPAVCLNPIEVGSSVPDSMRAAITEGKYICFKALLKNSDVRPHTLLSVDFVKETISAVTSPAADASTSSPMSFVDWVSAWNIFSTILISHKGEVEYHAKMAVHFEQVLDLYKEGGKWQYYDETFRRQVATGSVAWGQVHAQAQIKAFARPSTSSAPSNRVNTKRHFSRRDIPVGFCRDFNDHGCRKNACTYQHVCCNCLKKGHGAFSCFAQISLPFRSPPASSKPRHGSRPSGASGREAGSGGRGGKSNVVSQ